MVYDVMGARTSAWFDHGALSAEAAPLESARPAPGVEAGSGAGALTALPRRVQAHQFRPARAAQPEVSLLQRVLQGLERL